MDNDDKIIVDLKDDNLADKTTSANSVNAVSPSLRKKIIDELGLSEPQKTETKAEQEQQPSLPAEDNNSITGDEKYQDFLERYETSKSAIKEKTVAKYNSELDFMLNKKIKKVSFPKTKTQKLIITIIVCVCVLTATLGLIFGLQDRTPPIILSNISISQPIDNNVYQVSDVYVGDKLNYSNIYLICKYSDGSVKHAEIKRNMMTTNSPIFDNNTDTFTASGNVEFIVSYKGMSLKINYAVKSFQLEKIILDVPQMDVAYNILATTKQLNISNLIIVNAKYSNGRTPKISLSNCKYKHAGLSQYKEISNGKIDLSALESGQIYEIELTYQEGEIVCSAKFKIKTEF